LTVTPRNHHGGTLQGLTATTAVPPRDGRQGSDFTSLSGNSGQGVIFGAQRSAANDPPRPHWLLAYLILDSLVSAILFTPPVAKK